MNPSADTLALSSIEYDVTKVPLGQQVTVLWRKQPLFVRHRTPTEIAEAVADDHAPMKDPATDASRVKPGKSEWLILIGVCTHLGCTPTFGQGEYGGWLCPCHGSVYDTSGRIRKGPAPQNLVRAGLHLPLRHQDQGRLNQIMSGHSHLRAEDRPSSAGSTRACRSSASAPT